MIEKRKATIVAFRREKCRGQQGQHIPVLRVLSVH